MRLKAARFTILDDHPPKSLAVPDHHSTYTCLSRVAFHFSSSLHKSFHRAMSTRLDHAADHSPNHRHNSQSRPIDVVLFHADGPSSIHRRIRRRRSKHAPLFRPPFPLSKFPCKFARLPTGVLHNHALCHSSILHRKDHFRRTFVFHDHPFPHSSSN